MEEIWFQILIGLVTSLFGFIVGRANNRLNLRREIQKERFDNLYMPFVRLYDITHMAAAYNFEDFSKEIQNNYVELLVENMVYAPKFIRDYIIQFMMLYHDVYMKKDKSEEDIKSLNKTFNAITELLFGEYNYYGNKIYYSYEDRMRNYRIKKNFKRIVENNSENDVFIK